MSVKAGAYRHDYYMRRKANGGAPLRQATNIQAKEYASLPKVLSKAEQLEIILKSNPAEDDYHTWIRSEDDIQTFYEVFEEAYDVTPDFTEADVQKALDTGKITVYSSKPIVNGNFVSPSKMEAQAYAGDSGVIYQATVSLDDIAWVDDVQGQVATRRRIKYTR